MSGERPLVAIAAPLPQDLAARITELEPRLELAYEPELLPPMRFAADYSGGPDWRRSPEQQRRYEALIDGADILYGIPDVDPVALHRTVRANPRLRWVQTMAAGGGGQVKAAGLDADDLARVVFTTSAGVHGTALAEFAVLGVLAGAKHLSRLNELQRERVWADRWTMGQVAGSRVLVLGLGGIGAEVARLLTALGATVVGASRSGAPVAGVALVVRSDALLTEAGRADAIVTTLPGTASTEGLLGAELLAAVRPGTTIVNVGRGTVIDEAALLAALDDGRVGFAALDVFAVEPLPVDSPLWAHPRVLVSPHTAALTDAEERRIAELFADNATRFLDGRELVNRVDTVEFY